MINRRRLIYFVGFAFIAWLLGSYLGSLFVTMPNPVKIPPAEKFFNFPVEAHTYITSDSVQIAAWYLPNSKEKSVILMNGYRGNRQVMVERAKLYYDRGFSVLMPDLRGTGESEEVPITLGWLERFDLKASCDFLRSKGHEKIAVHGLSLGAATIAYSLQDQPDYWFAVLESCYDNIDQTFQNRLDMFYVPAFTCGFLRYCTEWQLGVESEKLSPEEYLKGLNCPVLIMAGDSEYRVKQDETERIFKNCGASDKRLHFFKGARHQDFLKYNEQEFVQVWGDFVAQFNFDEVVEEEVE